MITEWNILFYYLRTILILFLFILSELVAEWNSFLCFTSGIKFPENGEAAAQFHITPSTILDVDTYIYIAGCRAAPFHPQWCFMAVITRAQRLFIYSKTNKKVITEPKSRIKLIIM